jgi:UDP-N-acetylglucosamine 2-epimerase
MDQLKIKEKEYYVLTIHRAKNTGGPGAIKKIMNFVNSNFSDKPVIFPVHPRTKKLLPKIKSLLSDNIRVAAPVGHLDMVYLIKNACAVLTDSGGLQEESYWLGIPCITLRNETELVETIESGGNVLYKDFKGLKSLKYKTRDAYGKGDAAARIASATMKLASKI